MIRAGIIAGIGIFLMAINIVLESKNPDRRNLILTISSWALILCGFLYFLVFLGDNAIILGWNLIRKLSP